jgi:hypothetical protein
MALHISDGAQVVSGSGPFAGSARPAKSRRARSCCQTGIVHQPSTWLSTDAYPQIAADSSAEVGRRVAFSALSPCSGTPALDWIVVRAVPARSKSWAQSLKASGRWLEGGR